jgi:ligand-binding sensor domain-containing protein
LASTAGGFNIWAPAYFEPACSFFQNGQWNYLSTEFQTPTYAHDLVKVVVNPDKTEECFVSSWGNGLYKCVNGKVVTHYNQSNSPLRGMTNEEVARVSGLCYDAYGNLWVTNSGTVNTLHVLKTDGKWVTINSLRGDINTIAQHVYVDSRGYKWITFPRSSSQSLYVYDDNKTIENQTDDRLRVVNMNAAAEVESSVVKCITEDKNGRMWIGTNKGVKVIYNPSQVFDGGSLPRNIILEQGGYAAVLLEFEEVSCIAVDGANRKWMGTTKAGVFLISENGTEELMHLTAENSVLLSNVIYDIAIDGTTGEVFFSTDKGICSYRGTATEGEEEWYIDVKVFPNPVHSGYTGVIAVSGLMENSFCKIVDAAGNLIWQGYANGGELVWDGKDFRGRRPATGVYFVFSSSKSGKEKNVAKILFVN